MRDLLREIEAEATQWEEAARETPHCFWTKSMAEQARLAADRAAEAAAAPPAPPPPRPPSRFGHRRSNGLEELWIKGAHGPRMIHGWASTARISTNNQSLSPLGCHVPRFPLPIFFAHEVESKEIGECVYL